MTAPMNEPLTEPANTFIVATEDMGIIADRDDDSAEKAGNKPEFRWFIAGEKAPPYTWAEVVARAGGRTLIHLHRGDVVL